VTTAVLTPFHRTQAVELGNRLWRKKVLPVGDVQYQGRTLHFTLDYLKGLARAFTDRAYDQVAFQLADAKNTHTNDPERYRGEITAMEAEPDGLWLTVNPTEDGEKVLKANPRLGVSARIVENYDRSDGKHYPAAIQHVLGTLDPRIPGLGGWQVVEAATPVPEAVYDLSGASFAGEEPELIDLDWAAWDAGHHGGRDAMAKMASGHDRGGSDEEKAANHIADAKKAAGSGQHAMAMSHLARATQLSSSPAVHSQASALSKGVKQMAQQAGNSAAGSWNTLANDSTGLEIPSGATGRTDGMPDLDNLTDEQKARLAKLLDLPDEQVDLLAAGGTVITPEELEALTAPSGEEAEDADLADAIAGLSDEDIAALEAEWEAEEAAEEGEPVGAALSAEAQFAIDLANARAEETQRELAVVQARLREEDYQAEKRRMADLGVPPHITELARPLLEGAGHAVELANGNTVDAGAIMRKVLAEYARTAQLLDLGVELGSPHDAPEDAADEHGRQLVTDREDVITRFKSMTGLK
jgi:broad specificity phosphatase PhoE